MEDSAKDRGSLGSYFFRRLLAWDLFIDLGRKAWRPYP